MRENELTGMQLKYFAPALVLAAGLALFTEVSPAKPDYTRRTSQACEYCHPPNSRALNEAGEYYAAHKRSLVGYKPKEQGKDKASPNKSAEKAK